MRLTRLQLNDQHQAEPLAVVSFDRDIAVLDVDRETSTRIRLALETLFRGNSDFGQAFVTIDEIEIEVSSELAQHLGYHFGERSRILDSTAARTDAGHTGSVAAVALRSALEMLRAVSSQLDHRTVDATLQAVLADQKVLETEAHMKVVEAAGKQANAQVALGKIAHWRASVAPLHNQSTEARAKARRRLSGPLAYRRYAKLRDQEMESLEAANFENYEDFDQHATDAEARYRRELHQAAQEHADAKQYHSSLVERTCQTPQARLLAVYEFALRLRLNQYADPNPISTANQNALHQTLSIMIGDGAGLTDVVNENLITHASNWLAHTESRTLRQDLAQNVLAHAEPLPAVGTVPLIFDGLFEDVEPSAAARALTALDPYVGVVQIISLRYDPAIARWAHGHGVLPTTTQP